jgi:hypothetical protein
MEYGMIQKFIHKLSTERKDGSLEVFYLFFPSAFIGLSSFILSPPQRHTFLNFMI